MDSLACDKAGCSNVATWNRLATLVANHVPEHLCDRHYHELVQERPALALHYDPLVEGRSENARSSPDTSVSMGRAAF